MGGLFGGVHDLSLYFPCHSHVLVFHFKQRNSKRKKGGSKEKKGKEKKEAEEL